MVDKGGLLMSKNEKKEFNSVTKIYDSTDYKKQNEVSKGLAVTHEQVSDAYMVGEVSTNNPENHNTEDKQE